MKQPTFSVLISSRNEGGALRKTLESLFRNRPPEAFEVIVVDDASDDGSLAFIEQPPYHGESITALRNPTRRGLIYSRARAASLARGKYLCVLDAHCCVMPEWLETLAERLSLIGDQGLVVPRICPLDARTWTVKSRDLSPACTIVNPFFDFSWTRPTIVDGLPCTCTIGGGAWMCNRDWYRHVGGLDQGMVCWGGENIDFPLRTWLMGGWCLVAEDVEVGHLFGSQSTENGHGEAGDADSDRSDAAGASNGIVALAFNKIRAAHTVFEKRSIARIIKNLRHVPGFDEALALVKADARGLASVKAHVEAGRTRSDRWLIETFELPVLEAPVFYKPRKLNGEERFFPRRPSVSIVITASGRNGAAGDSISSVLEETTYARFEVLVVSCGNEETSPGVRAAPAGVDTTRLRTVEVSRELGGGLAQNMGALLSEAEYLVFLGEGTKILDPHWLEKLLLLFESQPRLLFASPAIEIERRPVEAGESARTSDVGDVFDVLWDWHAPGFSRERPGPAPSEDPYEALSCPATCLIVHRERFLELGGFDRTVRQGPPPVMDLAIHGWLAGYEVFCHPGVRIRRPGEIGGGAGVPDTPALRKRLDYSTVLPAVKYFTSPRRQESCHERCPEAHVLLDRHEHHIKRRRRQFLKYAMFDDDWLFSKFGIEDASGRPTV